MSMANRCQVGHAELAGIGARRVDTDRSFQVVSDAILEQDKKQLELISEVGQLLIL